jgi:hypothetical protein
LNGKNWFSITSIRINNWTLFPTAKCVKVNWPEFRAELPPKENQISLPYRIILCVLTKKPQLPSGSNFEKPKITGKMHLIALALYLLNRTRCGLGCVSGGELGKNTTHAPAALPAGRIAHQ